MIMIIKDAYFLIGKREKKLMVKCHFIYRL
jgi:hypothetical protein